MEVRKITDEERLAILQSEPHRYKHCVDGVDERNIQSDCKHLVAYVNWWCVSEDAREYRGTAIPGVCHCPFWEPKPIKAISDHANTVLAFLICLVVSLPIFVAMIVIAALVSSCASETFAIGGL